jgi:phosphate/sulfate permease
MGIPLSTTHCKVGAVVSVGLTYDKESLKFDTEKIEKYKRSHFLQKKF